MRFAVQGGLIIGIKIFVILVVRAALHDQDLFVADGFQVSVHEADIRPAIVNHEGS